jgi:alkylation response protein AidB-like acyl-CoA dehydrogenase
MQIFEGTNQIQRMVISRALARGDGGALHTDPRADA